MNPCFLPALLLYFCLFVGSYILAKKKAVSKSIQLLLICVGILLSLPFFGYYLHLIQTPLCYIKLRSIVGIEILSGGLGISFGLLSNRFKAVDRVVIFIIFIMGIGFSGLPFIKNLIRPLRIHLENTVKDGITIQTTPSTCGPSCLATIFRQFNIEKTEKEVAENAYTSGSGTEIWYLLRYAAKNGLTCKIHRIKNLEELEMPAIIGVWLGNYGHFISILEKKDSTFVIGDPLQGRDTLTTEKFLARYTLDGAAFSFQLHP